MKVMIMSPIKTEKKIDKYSEIKTRNYFKRAIQTPFNIVFEARP